MSAAKMLNQATRLLVASAGRREGGAWAGEIGSHVERSKGRQLLAHDTGRGQARAMPANHLCRRKPPTPARPDRWHPPTSAPHPTPTGPKQRTVHITHALLLSPDVLQLKVDGLHHLLQPPHLHLSRQGWGRGDAHRACGWVFEGRTGDARRGVHAGRWLAHQPLHPARWDLVWWKAASSPIKHVSSNPCQPRLPALHSQPAKQRR